MSKRSSKNGSLTRFYLCFMVVGILTTIVVTASIPRTVEKVEHLPSSKKFAHLIGKYPSTLHCPCSQMSIAYETFVFARVEFHQVCSSQFIQQSWIDVVFAEQNRSATSIDDHRRMLSFFWQVIADYCDISKSVWVNTLTAFGGSHMLSSEAVAENVVRSQAEASLDDQKQLAQTAFARNSLLIRRIVSGNRITSGMGTNFYRKYLNRSMKSQNSLRMTPRTFGNCSCLKMEGCPHAATMVHADGHLIEVPGMIADCLMMDGTLASTLECYHERACLSLLHQQLSSDIKPLLPSSNKYFLENATVKMLMDDMMIDELFVEIRFDLYYSQCNPAYCTYSFSRRFDLLYMITTIIGIFDWLSLGLHMIAPMIVTVILRHKNRVAPSIATVSTNIPQPKQRKFNYYSTNTEM